jgi:hypothetical protein
LESNAITGAPSLCLHIHIRTHLDRELHRRATRTATPV